MTHEIARLFSVSLVALLALFWSGPPENSSAPTPTGCECGVQLDNDAFYTDGTHIEHSESAPSWFAIEASVTTLDEGSCDCPEGPKPCKVRLNTSITVAAGQSVCLPFHDLGEFSCVNSRPCGGSLWQCCWSSFIGPLEISIPVEQEANCGSGSRSYEMNFYGPWSSPACSTPQSYGDVYYGWNCLPCTED